MQVLQVVVEVVRSCEPSWEGEPKSSVEGDVGCGSDAPAKSGSSGDGGTDS